MTDQPVDLVGYSASNFAGSAQNPDLQIQALKKSWRKLIYADKVGGTIRKHP